MSEMLQRIKTRCVHFTGVQHDVCKVGVRYEDLPREKPPVGLIQIPCINPSCGGCDKRQFPTNEQAQIEADEWEETIEKFLGRLKDGDCPHCGVKVTKRIQVGPCVYAEPCGHRIGQGKA